MIVLRETAAQAPFLPPGSPAVWSALARRIVPRSLAAGEEAEARFLSVVGEALAERPSLARPLAAFLALVRWLPVLLHGRRFERLGAARQEAFLRMLERSRLAPVRQGFAGVRTLVLMGHYGRPELGPELHYEPSREGNGRLHG
jgi:hypothetical protein